MDSTSNLEPEFHVFRGVQKARVNLLLTIKAAI